VRQNWKSEKLWTLEKNQWRTNEVITISARGIYARNCMLPLERRKRNGDLNHLAYGYNQAIKIHPSFTSKPKLGGRKTLLEK
jgi:hypothetical protein